MADEERGPRSRALFAVTLAISACSPAPSAVAPPATPPATASSTPSEEPAATASNPEPSEPDPEPEPVVGIAACDRYLVAYQKCEPKLLPEIQAGNRRTYAAEKNWLVFMKSRPEGKELEATCQSMIAELTKSCD